MKDRIKELRDKAALFREKAARTKNERQRDFLLEVAHDSERTIARIMKSNAASENHHQMRRTTAKTVKRTVKKTGSSRKKVERAVSRSR